MYYRSTAIPSSGLFIYLLKPQCICLKHSLFLSLWDSSWSRSFFRGIYSIGTCTILEFQYLWKSFTGWILCCHVQMRLLELTTLLMLLLLLQLDFFALWITCFKWLRLRSLSQRWQIWSRPRFPATLFIQIWFLLI